LARWEWRNPSQGDTLVAEVACCSDGAGGSSGNDARLRRVGMAAVRVAMCPTTDGASMPQIIETRFGGVPGRQIVPRAVLVGATQAIGPSKGRQGIGWWDASYVVNGARKEKLRTSDNGDLWCDSDKEKKRAAERYSVSKIKANDITRCAALADATYSTVRNAVAQQDGWLGKLLEPYGVVENALNKTPSSFVWRICK
jgi:hypothetical protein